MSKKLDQHELMVELKELAHQLGRTPKRDEFIKAVPGGRRQVDLAFGSYSTFLQAAGLDPEKIVRKIGNDIFNKDLSKHLEDYEPRLEIKPLQFLFKDAKIASISDIHWPFHSQRVIDLFVEFCEETQPDFIIINGDAWDFYSHSKYPKSVNIFTPRDEEKAAREQNEIFWKRIKKVCPKARYLQSLGNHDIRPIKRVIEEYPAAEDWIQDHFKKLFTFEGVETVFDYRQEIIINDIAIFHGYRSKLGDHRDYIHMKCMIGHQHVGGTVFRRIHGKTIWECNSGVAGDIEAKGLAYTPQKMTHQTPGFSYVDKYGPRFIAV